MKRATAALTTAGASAGALLVWAALIEPRRLVMRHRRIAPPGWPGRLDGLRVAVVSDLHAGAPHVGVARVRRIAARLARESPDVVALLGDFLDPHVAFGERLRTADVIAPLARIPARLGTFAVLGNHDWIVDGEGVIAALREHGATVLENDARATAAGVWIAGVADASTRRPDVHAALGAVDDDDAPVLLLSHDPDVFPGVPDRVALTLSGHTHAGQVNLPLLRRRAIPSQFGDRYAGGHVVERGRHLLVSRGIGTSRWPLRLAAPPEVLVVTLRAAS